MTIAASEALEKGLVRKGDLVTVEGGCPRHAGDRVTLVGGYRATVVIHEGVLYYKITHSPYYEPTRQRRLASLIAHRYKIGMAHSYYRRPMRQRLLICALIGFACGIGAGLSIGMSMK